MTRWIVLIAGLLGIVGVTIGAYAAHGLEASLVKQGLESADIAKRLSQCDVAVRYHMLHTLALLAIGLSSAASGRLAARAAACSMLLGIVLFSGGLYSMVFLGEMGHWAIVPSGGLCFILGWLFVAGLALFGTAGAHDHHG
ncbi:MAG: DUF423 domain-containing protein [Pirellulaceae bacterium]